MSSRQYQHQYQPNNNMPFSNHSYAEGGVNDYYPSQPSFSPSMNEQYYYPPNDYSTQQANAYPQYNPVYPDYYYHAPNEYTAAYYNTNHPNAFPAYQTSRPKITKGQMNPAGFLSQFQAASGQIDVNKMLATVGQLANTVQQVTPMLKQLSNLIKKG